MLKLNGDWTYIGMDPQDDGKPYYRMMGKQVWGSRCVQLRRQLLGGHRRGEGGAAEGCGASQALTNPPPSRISGGAEAAERALVPHPE